MKTAGLLLSPEPILTTFRGRPSELWPTTVTCTNQGSVLGHSSQSQLSITWARCGKVAARQSSQEEMVAKLW